MSSYKFRRAKTIEDAIESGEDVIVLYLEPCQGMAGRRWYADDGPSNFERGTTAEDLADWYGDQFPDEDVEVVDLRDEVTVAVSDKRLAVLLLSTVSPLRGIRHSGCSWSEAAEVAAFALTVKKNFTTTLDGRSIPCEEWVLTDTAARLWHPAWIECGIDWSDHLLRVDYWANQVALRCAYRAKVEGGQS